MSVWCSSSNLLSRFSSEATEQFEPCYLPSMSTKRLDLPCNFPQKDAPRAQPVRPASLSVEKPFEAKTNSSSLNIPSSATFGGSKSTREVEFREKDQSLKRFVDDEDEICRNRANKRKRGKGDFREEESKVNIWMQQPETFIPFVSDDVARQQLLPLSINAWVDCATTVKEVTDIGEKKDVEEPSQHHHMGVFGSSSSSESRGFSSRLKKNPLKHESTELGKVVMRHSEYVKHKEEDEGFELISLLVACVEEISSKNIPGINQIIARLGVLASPMGSSPISRVVAYFTEALVLRVVKNWPHIFEISPPRFLDRVLDDDYAIAIRLLNQVTPIPRFIYFTTNEILLRVFEGKDKVHIIDFDIKQGLQWPGLIQSLASRTTPPSHIRVTGIGKSKHELIEVGSRLSGIAESLNLAFEFHPVVDSLEDVRLWMLHVKENETVAINCMFQLHKLLYDNKSSGVFTEFLELIRSTNPKIMIMAEQETENNDDNLETRLVNSLRYYSAIFDSLEGSVSSDNSLTRMKIEEMYAREIKNIIATEGNERVERHQGFEKWVKTMVKGGFRGLNISERELLQSQMLLKMYYEGENNYEVWMNQEEEGSGITISWLDQPLYTVSAWEMVHVVADSSSFASSPFAKS